MLFAGRLMNWRGVGLMLPGAPRPVYLNVSHHPLAETAAVARLLRRTGAALVPLVHDLSPIDWPEYVSTAETLRHRRRLATTASHASAVVANSAATALISRPPLPEGLPLLPTPLADGRWRALSFCASARSTRATTT